MLARCPICKKPTDSDKDADFPFCSERCRQVDLGNWSSEEYKISEPAADESEGDMSQPSSRDETES